MKKKPNSVAKVQSVKRLAPRNDVVRRLFLDSGNLCAYPGCNRPLMDSEGRFLGNLCHIEAAETDGPRFNEHQTNEQRRGYPNLLLLCYEHHVITNDEAVFTVPRMVAIKHNHRKKVATFGEQLAYRVANLAAADVPRPAKSLLRFWPAEQRKGLTEADAALTVAQVNALLTRIHALPQPVRSLLVVIVEYAAPDRRPGATASHFWLHEIQLVTRLGDRVFNELLHLLDHRNFIIESGGDDHGHRQYGLRYLDGWDIWTDFSRYADGTGITLAEMISDLNFSLLD